MFGIREQVVKVEDDAASRKRETLRRMALERVKYADLTANKILRITSPKTKYTLSGFNSYSFLFWYIAVSFTVFAVLFWEFYTQSCSVRSEIIPNTRDLQSFDIYNSGRNYLCNAKFMLDIPVGLVFTGPFDGPFENKVGTAYCQLGNIPQSDMAKLRSDLCSYVGIHPVGPLLSYTLNSTTNVFTTEMLDTPPVLYGQKFNCEDGLDLARTHSVKDIGPYSNSYYVGSRPALSIEYVSCEATSTCLINTIQYTTACQFVAVGIFFLLWKIADFLKKFYEVEDGNFGCNSDASKTIEAVDIERHYAIQDETVEVVASPDSSTCAFSFSTTATEEAVISTAIVTEEFVSEELEETNYQQLLGSGEQAVPLIDQAASTLLRSTAPRSTYKFSGAWAVAFVAWYVIGVLATLGSLLWYFIEGGCVVQRRLVSRNLGSDFYTSSFNTKGNHLCNSRYSEADSIWAKSNYPFTAPPSDLTFKYPCVLDGLSCSSDYGGVGSSLCSSIECDDSVLCANSTQMAEVEVEYTSCIDLYVAIMTAIQFTVCAETIALAVYFLVYLLCNNGFSVLLERKTYYGLWRNKPVIGQVQDDGLTGKEYEFQSQKGGSETESGLEKEIVNDIYDVPAYSANRLLHFVAPHSKVKIEGVAHSVAFIVWFLGSCTAMFVLLLWYFYNNQCYLKSSVVDANMHYDAMQALFFKNGNYFCTARHQTSFLMKFGTPNRFGEYPKSFYDDLYTLECLPPSFTPDQFQTHSLCPASKVKQYMVNHTVENCDPIIQFNNNDAGVISAPRYCISSYTDFVDGVRGPNFESFEYYFPSNGSIVLPPDLGHCISLYGDGFQGAPNNNAPVLQVDYISCTPISTSIAAAAQFTFYGQTFIMALYFFARKVALKDTKVESFLRLWENEEL